MAGLLNWLGNTAKKVEDTASRAYDQLNPLDNGLSYQTRQVNPNVQPQSVIQQGTNIVRPMVNQAQRAGVQVYESPVGRLFGPSRSQMIEQIARQNPAIAPEIRNQGYQDLLHDSGIGMNDSKATIFRKSASDIGGTVANFIPVGKTASLVASPAKRLLANTAESAVAGATSGALSALHDTTNVKDIAKSAGEGAVIGGALPVAGAVVGKTAQLATKTPLNDRGYIQVGRTPKNIHPEDQATMADFIDKTRGVYKPDPQTAYNLDREASHIADRYGITPSANKNVDPATRLANAFDKRLQQSKFSKPSLFKDERGSVGLTNDPLESLRQEALKYKSADEFVKAQGEPLYHGSPNHKIIRKEGFKSNPNGNNLLGEGVYMTRHRAKAENYSLPSDLPRGTTITPEMRSAGVVEGYIPKGSKIYQPETRAELKNISTKELQQQGFDGIEINGETVIFDQSKIKTREQLTDLYNQATQPQPPKSTPKAEAPDPLESLKQEARKYKSADEFVKAQGEPVYHRSPNKFSAFDISRVSNDSNRQGSGWGIYSSDSDPGSLYGHYLYEARISKDALIDSQNPVKENVVSKIVDAVKKTGRNPSELNEFSYNGMLFYKTLSRILGGDKNASSFLYKNGIDGLRRSIGKNANDYILFNDASIKTKQQLTDLYNQAHKPSLKEKLVAPFKNEGGFVKIPGGKNDPAPDLKLPRKDLVNQYAETLQSIDDGAGVSIMPDNTRSSSHSPFYRQIFADKGRPPTKLEWFNEARQQLENGKADSMFQDEFSKLNPDVESLLSQGHGYFAPDPKRGETFPVASANAQQPSINPDTRMQIQPNRAISKTTPAISEKTVPQPQQILPSENLNVKQYITDQKNLQKQAQGNTSKLGGARQELAVKAIDALSSIEKPVEKVVGRSGNLALRNQLDRSLRSNTIAGQFAKDNGIHNIIKSVPDTNAFDQYLIAKHGQDLNANGIKTGRNLANDKALIDQLAPQYEGHAKAIADYNGKLLDKTVEYGLISKDTADFLKKKYPNYVPFDRIFKDGELTGQKGNGAGPASLSTQTVVQRIKGSDRQIHSPLESILAKTHDVIAQGERNLAAKEIVSTKDLPGNPLGLKEIKPNETIGNRSTISFIENGVKRTFETTPEVAQAAKSLNKEQLGLIGKVLSYPTRALRLGATGVNVGFTAANVVKDLATGALNSEHPFRSSVGNPSVFMDALKAATNHGSQQYQEITRQGAGGTSFDIARNAAETTVKKIRADKNVGTRVLYTVKHPGELLRAVEDTIGRSEEFGRALQYYGNKQASLSKGLPMSQATAYASDAARNNTTNFARAGEYGRVLNSVLPYFNAGIQGSRTFTRNLRDRPVQTGAKLAVGTFMPIATVTAWNLSDPKRREAYNDIPDYEKTGNIVIIPPNPQKDPNTGKWNAIKIPLSQEVANLGGVVRNGVETLAKDNSFNFSKLAGNLTGSLTSLNVSSGRDALNQVTPQAIKPLIETATNQNLFTGNKIVPDSKANLPAPDQYGNNTSGTAKVLGKLTNNSPYKIDNAIRTTFAGAGQNAVNISDNILAKVGAISSNDIKGTPLGLGVTNRFYGANGGSGYNNASKVLSTAQQQLENNPAFQALSQKDKASALNRLKRDITNTEVSKYFNQFGGKTPPPKLTSNQQNILSSGLDPNKYATTPPTKGLSISPNLDKNSTDTISKYNSMTAQQRKQWLSSSKDAEYQLEQAKYNNDKASGNISDTQDIARQKLLAKSKVGADYNQNIRDLYNLSKDSIASYLKTHPSDQTVNDLKAYDQALYNAGLSSSLKFKNGIAPTARRTAGRRSTGRRVAKRSTRTVPKPASSYKQTTSTIKTPKAPSIKTAQFKGKTSTKTALKQYKVPKLA